MRTPIAPSDVPATVSPSATMSVTEAIELALCDLGCPSPRRHADASDAGDSDASVRDRQRGA